MMMIYFVNVFLFFKDQSMVNVIHTTDLMIVVPRGFFFFDSSKFNEKFKI